jgi:hypothetical protein
MKEEEEEEEERTRRLMKRLSDEMTNDSESLSSHFF